MNSEEMAGLLAASGIKARAVDGTFDGTGADRIYIELNDGRELEIAGSHGDFLVGAIHAQA